MTYSEDDLVNALIRGYENAEFVHVIEPEAEYDDDGMRGFPDLHVVVEWLDEGIIVSELIEVKSEYAVRSATGANEIIRQFNKMRRHFYDGNGRVVPMRQFEWQDLYLGFELAFIPSMKNLVHLIENKEMYNYAIQNSQGNISRLPRDQNMVPGFHNEFGVSITFRHPDQPDRPMTLASVSGRNMELENTLPPTPEQISVLKSIDTHLYNKMKILLEGLDDDSN